jgi:class 3 adenylate cyclase
VAGLDPDLLLRTSGVQYARSASAHVAYRVVTGKHRGVSDVVLMLAGTASMEALFEDAIGVRWLGGLAELGRLVVFDRCGIGLSDPPPDSSIEGFVGWCRDVEAVVAAVSIDPVVLVTHTMGSSAAFLYCDRHPDQVTALVLFEPAPIRVDRRIIDRQLSGEIDSVALYYPSRANEPGFRDWFTRAGQFGASPARAAVAYPMPTDDEQQRIERAARRLKTRTLVLRRPAHRFSPDRSSDPILALVPAATRVDLPGDDLSVYGSEVDALLAEVSWFVTGARRLPEPSRVLAALMVCDVVGSTQRNYAEGDTRWTRLLDVHDATVRGCIERRGGAVIKTMGDGVLATLPSCSSAVHAADELRAALAKHDLVVRIGIHVGDIDMRGEDIAGLAVVAATRVNRVARPGEILLSSIAVGATLGAPFQFEPRGQHELQGVPGTWDLFALSSARRQTDGAP